MASKATTIGIALTIALVGILSVVPVGTGYDHGGDGGTDPGPARALCPTDPAYNATDSLVADGTGQTAVHVDIVDFEPYDPAVLTIDAGTCVEWENHGDLAHTVDIVASTDRIPEHHHVATLQPGGATHHVFDDPGVYYLHCEINAFHEATMHQVIRVV